LPFSASVDGNWKVPLKHKPIANIMQKQSREINKLLKKSNLLSGH